MSFKVKFFSSPMEAAAEVIISKLRPDSIWLSTPTRGSWFFWWSASSVCREATHHTTDQQKLAYTYTNPQIPPPPKEKKDIPICHPNSQDAPHPFILPPSPNMPTVSPLKWLPSQWPSAPPQRAHPATPSRPLPPIPSPMLTPPHPPNSIVFTFRILMTVVSARAMRPVLLVGLVARSAGRSLSRWACLVVKHNSRQCTGWGGGGGRWQQMCLPLPFFPPRYKIKGFGFKNKREGKKKRKKIGCLQKLEMLANPQWNGIYVIYV